MAGSSRPIALGESQSVLPIRRFWEKPAPELAASLLSRGCLWNSFVMVGRVPTFIDLIAPARRSSWSVRARPPGAGLSARARGRRARLRHARAGELLRARARAGGGPARRRAGQGCRVERLGQRRAGLRDHASHRLATRLARAGVSHRRGPDRVSDRALGLTRARLSAQPRPTVSELTWGVGTATVKSRGIVQGQGRGRDRRGKRNRAGAGAGAGARGGQGRDRRPGRGGDGRRGRAGEGPGRPRP